MFPKIYSIATIILSFTTVCKAGNLFVDDIAIRSLRGGTPFPENSPLPLVLTRIWEAAEANFPKLVTNGIHPTIDTEILKNIFGIATDIVKCNLHSITSASSDLMVSEFATLATSAPIASSVVQYPESLDSSAAELSSSLDPTKSASMANSINDLLHTARNHFTQLVSQILKLGEEMAKKFTTEIYSVLLSKCFMQLPEKESKDVLHQFSHQLTLAEGKRLGAKLATNPGFAMKLGAENVIELLNKLDADIVGEKMLDALVTVICLWYPEGRELFINDLAKFVKNSGNTVCSVATVAAKAVVKGTVAVASGVFSWGYHTTMDYFFRKNKLETIPELPENDGELLQKIQSIVDPLPSELKLKLILNGLEIAVKVGMEDKVTIHDERSPSADAINVPPDTGDTGSSGNRPASSAQAKPTQDVKDTGEIKPDTVQLVVSSLLRLALAGTPQDREIVMDETIKNVGLKTVKEVVAQINALEGADIFERAPLPEMPTYVQLVKSLDLQDMIQIATGLMAQYSTMYAKTCPEIIGIMPKEILVKLPGVIKELRDPCMNAVIPEEVRVKIQEAENYPGIKMALEVLDRCKNIRHLAKV